MTAGEFPILPRAFETSVSLQLRFVYQRQKILKVSAIMHWPFNLLSRGLKVLSCVA